MLSKLHSLHRYYQEQVLAVCAASATCTQAAKGIVLLALPGMKPYPELATVFIVGQIRDQGLPVSSKGQCLLMQITFKS